MTFLSMIIEPKGSTMKSKIKKRKTNITNSVFLAGDGMMP